jgi:hypothetical protein
LEILPMKSAVIASYTKLAKHLPGRFRALLEASLLNPIQLIERWEIRQAERSGPPYRPSHRKIIIDITAACDLRCVDCNRSCGEGQAVSNEYMSVAQIEKFVGESETQGRMWEEIALEGGEPTLHPGLAEIVEILLQYKKIFSPRTNIHVQTNGYRRNRRGLELLRRQGILVVDTRKRSNAPQHPCALNLAPCDQPGMEDADFSLGCFLPACYGLGLTFHGYYPHPVCGGIDRVFGFDIGRKSLPPAGDPLEEQFGRLCRLCGFSIGATGGVGMSESWRKAYLQYQEKKPEMVLY